MVFSISSFVEQAFNRILANTNICRELIRGRIKSCLTQNNKCVIMQVSKGDEQNADNLNV